MAATVTKTLQTIDTEYSADSVEWCGLPGYQDLLLCGTYQLEEKDSQEYKEEEGQPQVRVGRLYLYRLDKDDGDAPQLHQLASMDMPGILDIKWSQQAIGHSPLFGLVNSVGQLKILDTKENSVAMVTETELGECLGLSLEWNNTVGQREDTKLVVSDSAGKLHLYGLRGSGLELESSWTGHEFEAWIAAFDQWNPSVVMSGGDDCKLKTWDMRVGTDMPVRTSKSYDEQLLIWDTRSMKQPITELGLGGGIWRIKWKPDSASHILTATMYNGFHIVDTTNIQGGCLNVKCHYTEHQSIAYGADWCRSEPDMDIAIATCSFYDHTLTLWNYLDNKT